MVESEAQKEMARIESLHDTRFANGTPLESADTGQSVAITHNRNCVHWRCLVGHVGVLENPSLKRDPGKMSVIAMLRQSSQSIAPTGHYSRPTMHRLRNRE